MKSPEFVIYAFPWDERVGGNIVLHALCARLNELGFSAALWPYWKPGRLSMRWSGVRRWLGYLLKGRLLWRFDTGPFASRIARRRDLRDAVVVYPEIVEGNPLRARKIVRWLLYAPGDHASCYGPKELVMTYNEAFADKFKSSRVPLLRVTHYLPEYRQWNFGPRQGSAVLIRKGANRRCDQHPPDAILIDDLGHAEVAAILNSVERLYCYDLYTYTTIYAAVCGCIPIIVPEPGLSETAWEPDENQRLGRAYGEANVPWAVATRDRLRERLKVQRQSEDALVQQFARMTREYFAGR